MTPAERTEALTVALDAPRLCEPSGLPMSETSLVLMLVRSALSKVARALIAAEAECEQLRGDGAEYVLVNRANAERDQALEIAKRSAHELTNALLDMKKERDNLELSCEDRGRRADRLEIELTDCRVRMLEAERQRDEVVTAIGGGDKVTKRAPRVAQKRKVKMPFKCQLPLGCACDICTRNAAIDHIEGAVPRGGRPCPAPRDGTR